MFPLYYQKSSPSTNDDVLQYLEQQAGGCGLYTFRQTAGRGQYGNLWAGTPDENIAYTLALPCADIRATGHIFNYHTARTVRIFLEQLVHAKVEIKWPNDLIINQKKVAGILIEKKLSGGRFFYIIGIGINVLQTDFHNITKAASLYTASGFNGDLMEVATSLHEFLAGNLLQIEPSRVLSDFNENLFRKSQISVFEINNLRQNGIIKNADSEGKLWVELEHDGLKSFYHKEIALLY